MPGMRMSRMSNANSSTTSGIEQGLICGFGSNQPVAGIIQDSFEHGEVFCLIVHDQNVDGYVNRKIP